MVTRSFTQEEVDAQLQKKFHPQEIKASEDALARLKQKDLGVDDEAAVRIHCALSRVMRARGLKGRVTPEQIKNWSAKVMVEVKTSFKAWIVPENAAQLLLLPPDAFVDLRTVILPAGDSMEGKVLVHINVPASDLPFGLETLTLQKKTNVRLRR